MITCEQHPKIGKTFSAPIVSFEFHISNITIDPCFLFYLVLNFFFFLVLNFNLPKYFHQGVFLLDNKELGFSFFTSLRKTAVSRFCCLLCLPVSPICSFLSPALRDKKGTYLFIIPKLVTLKKKVCFPIRFKKESFSLLFMLRKYSWFIWGRESHNTKDKETSTILFSICKSNPTGIIFNFRHFTFIFQIIQTAHFLRLDMCTLHLTTVTKKSQPCLNVSIPLSPVSLQLLCS